MSETATASGSTDRARAAPGCTITWLGHSTALIEVDGVRVLTDPLLRRRLGPLIHDGPPIDPELVRAVDVVLLSHLHADHVDPGSLRRLRRDVTVVAPVGAAAWLRRRDLSDVRELPLAAEVELGTIRVASTPALHDGRRHRFAPDAEAIGFVVRGSVGVYFAGDTDSFDAMKELRGTIDVALLPVGGWGPSLGPGHMDPARAAEAAAMIEPRVAIPIHWGTLRMPGPLRRFSVHHAAGASFAQAAALVAPSVDVRVLQPGASTDVAPSAAAGA